MDRIPQFFAYKMIDKDTLNKIIQSIPKNVKFILPEAFAYISTSSMDLRKTNIEKVSEYAFEFSYMDDLYFPSSLKELDFLSLDNCHSENIYFEGKTLNNVLYYFTEALENNYYSNPKCTIHCTDTSTTLEDLFIVDEDGSDLDDLKIQDAFKIDDKVISNE